jgi:hypothetical protein
MTKGNFNTEITTNIINHLYVITNCPECNQQIGVSLGMIHRNEEGFCPQCLTMRKFHIKSNKLDRFVAAFDELYEQLQEYNLPLALYNNPVTTTWESI